MRKLEIVLFAVLIGTMVLLILFSATAPYVSATSGDIQNDIKVSWTKIHDGITTKEYLIEVQNLLGTNRTVDARMAWDSLSFSPEQLRNVQYFMLTNQSREFPVYGSLTENCLIENVTYFKQVTKENLLENVAFTVFYGAWNASKFGWASVSDNRGIIGAGYESASKLDNTTYMGFYFVNGITGYENKQTATWQEVKPKSYQRTDVAYVLYFGNLNLPATSSAPITDDFGQVTSENGTKWFKVKFDVPIVRTVSGWGSQGRAAIVLDGFEYCPWWDASWLYRRTVTISPLNPENYQLKVTLPFYDTSIRFLENENSGELNYWVETSTTDNMTIWVQRLENTDNTIYVYYGNAGVGIAENGDATFPFFDNFPNTSLNTSKWTVRGGTPAVVSGELTLDNATVAEGITGVAIFDVGYAIRMRSKSIGTNALAKGGGFTNLTSANFLSAAQYAGVYRHQNLGYAEQLVVAPATQSNFGAWADDSYHIWDIERDSTADVVYAEDNTTVATLNNDIPDSSTMWVHLSVGSGAAGGAGSEVVDWVFVRKFVSPEPTTSISNTPPTAPTNWTDLAANLTDNTPTITWTKGTDSDGDTVTTYVYVGENNLPTTVENYTTGATADLGTNVTLKYGTTYYYRLRSYDGTDYSSYTTADQFSMRPVYTVQLRWEENMENANENATLTAYMGTYGTQENAIVAGHLDNLLYLERPYWMQLTYGSSYRSYIPIADNGIIYFYITNSTDLTAYTFQLADLTGLYGPPSGTLTISKMYGTSSLILYDSPWQADMTISTYLIRNHVYQLTVKSDLGGTRIAGNYTVALVSPIIVQVGMGSYPNIPEIWSHIYWTAYRDTDNTTIRALFQDNTGLTTGATVTIYDENGTLWGFVEPDNGNFVVTWILAEPSVGYNVVLNVTRTDENLPTITLTTPISAIWTSPITPPTTGAGFGNPIPLSAIGSFIILTSLGLSFDAIRPQIAGIAIALMAAFLWMLGWLPLNVYTIFALFALAVLCSLGFKRYG